MGSSHELPARANLEHLRNEAKQRLKELRARDAEARLSDAQLLVAREYGFPSWRRLKAASTTGSEIASSPPHATEICRPSAALSKAASTRAPATRAADRFISSPRASATPSSSCSCASTRSATSARTG
jgi:hypothetical protein